MNHVRKVLSPLGGIFLAALLLAALAPKAARGVAAALVQIVPGGTTHLGQHESQLVSLFCFGGSNFCVSVDPTGVLGSTPYVVPSGYTLIVTDWEWQSLAFPSGQPGTLSGDILYVSSPNLGNLNLVNSEALADSQGRAFNHEHYEAGIRVGSGATIGDILASDNFGQAFIQGYLVPN